MNGASVTVEFVNAITGYPPAALGQPIKAQVTACRLGLGEQT